MLAVARKKTAAKSVQWIQANARATALKENFCDAIWSISTLHYFLDEEQKLFFSEMFRLLRPKGGLIVDTEFAEQHKSLWLVEFFPSLGKRYEGRIFPQDRYRTWLTQIGFSSVEFDHAELAPDDEDNPLRTGQYRPQRYLDERVLRGIPAF